MSDYSSITLNEGVSIPNILPYKHPFYQINEIEKIVNGILFPRIIRPSTNHYCSSITLLIKYDGGWRF